jgi:putative PIN family toxin of toxin-antitoxin system
MSAKPRVVIDTQLFLRAAINAKSLPAAMIFRLAGSYDLIISPAIRAEIYDVLNRPELRAKFPSLTDAVVEQVMSLFDAAVWIEPAEVSSVSRDPKDDIFLACAAAGSAEYIVSEDKDLLVLNPYNDIQIVNAADFLKILEAG